MLFSFFLNRNQDRRLRAGHLWVYSNELNLERSNRQAVKERVRGEVVGVRSDQGRLLGVGTWQPDSLIAIRIFSRTVRTLDTDFFRQRLQQADDLRQPFYAQPVYRLCNSEGDYLPGVIIDRYQDIYVLQLLTAGAERLRKAIVSALQELFHPAAVLLLNNSAARRRENLPEEIKVIQGDLSKAEQVSVQNLLFSVDFMHGQKTGLFLDQANHWPVIREFARDARVLDLFSYQGGWGMTAAAVAKDVTFVDRQDNAVTALTRNLELNRIQNGHIVQADAIQWLQESEGEYDLIIADPPAFIKSRKHQKAGEQSYLRLNQKLLNRITRGWLLTFSCSHLLSRDRLLDVLRVAALKSGREIRVVREFGHGPDHPLHPAMPETRYLKGFALAVQRL